MSPGANRRDAAKHAAFLAARGDRDDRERVFLLAVGFPPVYVSDTCPTCGLTDYVTVENVCPTCATEQIHETGTDP